ncbi:MAG TPA: AI-2E family transporter [Rhizomicrobium sp.]|jgi:predicted PurR-regulated permease PerM|nr:AI-2E family transporter [Rhizomicrobium sp.]
MSDLKPTRPVLGAAPDTLTPKFMMAVIAAVVVSGIYFGKPVLMPLALAVLMSFALAPLVALLKRWGLGHVAPVLISLTLAIVILSSLAGFMGSQLAKLAVELPRYQTNLSQKITSVVGSVGQNGTISALNRTLDNVVEQVAGERVEEMKASRADTVKPVPVVIRRTATTPWAMAQNVLGPLVEPLALIVMVLVFVGFILLQKDDLRDRIVRLAGSRDLQRTSVALDEAATRLSRFIFLQTLINTCFGLTIGFGLWLIGIPNSGLWGLMAMLLRFVPYVGVPLAFLFPATLALAVDPGWGRLVWVAALYGGIEAVIGQAIEPFVYGRSMGLSAVAVVVAAVFWTWLWGPVGLLLSTPLTMCFVVLGRHIQALKFLEVMLGDQPALRNEESLYLRMLAEDPDEAADEAEAYLRDHTLMDYYDQVAGNALMLAQTDVNRGVLVPQRQEHIRDAIKGLIVNLAHHTDEDAAAALPVLPHGWTNLPVLCVAGRGPLDEAAGLLLVDILEKHGLGARLVSSEETSAANIRDLPGEGVRLVCVSYLEPGTFKNARYQVRRLRKHMPDVPVLALFWGLGADHSRYLDSVEATESDIVTTGLRETVTHILAFARRAGVIQSAL